MKSNQDQELEIAELEHVVGYNGKFSNTIHFVPNSKNYFVYAIGGLIVLEDSEDQHNQRFLRGHDMAVSTLCVGHSGTLPHNRS
jgi:cilia- and flagella-associated protein 52